MRDLIIVIIAIFTLSCVVLGIKEIIFEASELSEGFHLTSWHYSSLTLYGIVILGLLFKKKQ